MPKPSVDTLEPKDIVELKPYLSPEMQESIDKQQVSSREPIVDFYNRLLNYSPARSGPLWGALNPPRRTPMFVASQAVKEAYKALKAARQATSVAKAKEQRVSAVGIAPTTTFAQASAAAPQSVTAAQRTNGEAKAPPTLSDATTQHRTRLSVPERQAEAQAYQAQHPDWGHDRLFEQYQKKHGKRVPRQYFRALENSPPVGRPRG